MAKVSFWKATDGSLHETHESYAAHEERLRIIEGIGKLSVSELNVASLAECDSDDQPIITLHELPAFIADNADLIRRVLADAAINKQRGPRGPRAKKVDESPATLDWAVDMTTPT